MEQALLKKKKLGLATRCQYMPSHKLSVTFPYMRCRKQRLYTFYILILTRKQVPVPSLSEEQHIYIFLFLLPVKRATKALGYIRGNTEVLSVVRDLKSHLEPWPPFAVSCRCLYYYRDVVGWRGAHRQLTSRFLPPHSFAP